MAKPEDFAQPHHRVRSLVQVVIANMDELDTLLLQLEKEIDKEPILATVFPANYSITVLIQGLRRVRDRLGKARFRLNMNALTCHNARTVNSPEQDENVIDIPSFLRIAINNSDVELS